MAKKLPHSCFTEQLHTEPCPKCDSTEAVFVGHGTVRHCTNCTISWGAGEVVIFSESELAEPVIKKKVKGLPADLQKSINELIKELDIASGLEDRLKRLRAISDDEWQRAVDSDAS